ncbi:unnamed protein product [Blepharisma stoltei]|uniref:MFS transporter n=1 Tax=Blepharisma stoltei TaxID=1481888 RepID=A0AAU9JSK9_9CILI|nr:unnamed protein product [Blepharisma stoltei]
MILHYYNMALTERRWVMLMLYFAINLINGATYCALDPVDKLAENYYGVNTDLISLFALSFSIMYIPLAPAASWSLGISYHWSMIFAWVITFLGCWIKYLAFENYTLALIGIFLVASMNSVVMAGCTPLAIRYFHEEELVLATSIGSISNFIGMGISFVLDPYLDDIDAINLFHAIFSTVFLAINFIFSHEDPAFAKAGGFKEGFIKALKNKMIMMIVFCSSSGLAVISTVIAILAVILEPDHVSEMEVGWIGFVMVMMGMVGGFIATYLSHKFNSLEKPLKIFLYGSILSVILWALIQENFPNSMIGSAIHGTLVIGHVPLAISGAVIQDKTIEESITTNMIYFMANLLEAFYIYPIQYFYKETNAPGLWAITILMAISFIPLAIVYKSPIGVDKQQINTQDAPSKVLLEK